MPAGHQAAHLDIVVSLPSSRTLLEEIAGYVSLTGFFLADIGLLGWVPPRPL